MFLIEQQGWGGWGFVKLEIVPPGTYPLGIPDF